MSRKVRTTSAALLLVFFMTTGGGVVVYQTASALGLVESMVVRTIFRTIALREAERRDRRNINVRRDSELADVALRERAVALQVANGTLSQADAARETERYQQLRTAITERAKRERQITSFQTRNRIRANLRAAVPDIIKAATGADPRAVDFLSSMLNGDKPITALLGAAVGGGDPVLDPRAQFVDLQATLKDVESAARALGGAQGLAVRTRLQQALREATGITDGEGEIPDDKLQRLRDLEGQIQTALEEATAIGRDLFPGSEGIDRDRFAGEERWQAIHAQIQALSGPLAGRAVVSSLMRNALAEVERLANEAGIALTDAQIAAMAAAVVEASLAERNASEEGLANGSTPFDDLVRNAINQGLATGGQPPLPDGDAPPPDESPLGDDPQPGDDPTVDADNDGDTIPNSSDQCPDAAEDVDGFEDANGCPDPDNDQDTILDTNDQCADVPEDFDSFQDADGCPDPDNDGDGMLDADDQCPDAAEDVDGFEDANGCPDPDNDQDTVLDASDQCPNEAEDIDGFEDADGCPDPDNDDDGILDASDQCPNQAEDLDGFQDADGCPDVALPTRSLAADFALGAYDAHLNLVIDFAAGAVSGTLSGSWTKLSGQFNCGQGNQVLDTAETFATASFSSGFSGTVGQAGGAYSAPVGINGTISYAVTKWFTHPSCTSGNAQLAAQLPPTSSFTASGTISGTALDGSPTSINVNTTLGSYAQ